jgi:flavin-dependent dehydrogenase
VHGGADTEPFDVAIIGGGLAGNLLARQLHRRSSTLRIGLFERSSETGFKVGEALVEVAGNYLIRKQGLTRYLYENQLPKNGLRYFFDRETRDCALEDMSEVGTTGLPFHPAFQIDRARFEADLLQMNRADGIEVATEASVSEVELGDADSLHRFRVLRRGKSTRHTARWIIDAAGRGGMFARLAGLRVAEPTHQIGSVWGRFEGVTDIDTLGPDVFRDRVRHTTRRLSTIHFWYSGYWIWFIPLRDGLTSIGVTGDPVAARREMRTPEGFREFLDGHRAVRELIQDAKTVDIGSYTKISYGTRRFFHPNRWAVIGEAATSADPLYSPGSDFIALENDYVTDLICRDSDGRGSEDEFRNRCDLYDRFMQFRHEATMLLYRNLYSAHGSFELARMKWDFDIGFYYNLWVSSYMQDQHLDADYLTTQLRLKPFVLQAMQNFSSLFRQVETHLRERGEYYRINTGKFHHGLTNIDFTEKVGTHRNEQQVMDKTLEIFNCVRAQAHVILGVAARVDEVEPLPLTGFIGRRGLV